MLTDTTAALTDTTATTTMASPENIPHIAMFPSPGMGHLIPFLSLAKLLINRRHISSATLILLSSTTSPLLQSLPETIRLRHLPPISPDDDSHQSPEAQIFNSISLSLNSAREALADATGSPIAALVVDPFGIDLLDKAKELNIPVYMYFGTAAMNLLFTFHLSTFDAMLAEDSEFRDCPDPFILPGCPPLHGRDFGDPFKTRNTPVFKRFLHLAEKSRSVDGILVNTFTHLEPGAISALKAPPVFPIGPIVGSSTTPSGPVMDWLDGQAARSVLYVSFGSGGTLSFEQTTELALGLEESGQRFVWVVRRPNDTSSCPSYCGGSSSSEDAGFLPEGLLERTRGRGLVVSGWAPQVAVLAHGSTGGFLTHCGWNSALESIMHGVTMLAWPLYAEQRTNAVVLTDGLGVAVRPEAGGSGVVGRGEIAAAVRRVMVDGDGLRRRAGELNVESEKAVGGGGSSSLQLIGFANRLKSPASRAF